MRSIQEKLDQIQALLYEVRREVAETHENKLSLDGRLAVESYKSHSRGPGA